ncbi:hypothetical protein DsansV1_C05g0058451 [Dioscorea sansibarensis]
MSTSQSLLFSSCSAMMGLLFAYSASVQLNDPDWYFWIPLYAIASIVNLLQRKFNQVTRFVLWSGLLLFIRVMIEGHVYGLANLWSMDMRKRVVREKVGSGLVVASMTLHLKASQISKLFVTLGMAALMALSYGLSLYFFVLAKDNMKYI